MGCVFEAGVVAGTGDSDPRKLKCGDGSWASARYGGWAVMGGGAGRRLRTSWCWDLASNGACSGVLHTDPWEGVATALGTSTV